MPSFQLKQFQQILNQLLLVFSLPKEFHAQLTALFERYEQPGYRYSREVQALPQPAYHLPGVMLEEIEIPLTTLAKERPRPALLLAQECWQDDFFETKWVAALVLGQAPLFDLPLLTDAINAMLAHAPDTEHLLLLFGSGVRRLREERFDVWTQMIAGWLSHDETCLRGLYALVSVVEAGNEAYMPTVFRLLEKPLIDANEPLRPILQRLVAALSQQSMPETTHFLYEVAINFYGEERLRFFRSLYRHMPQKQRTFIAQGFRREVMLLEDEQAGEE
jgi:hypothetical protein